ncbi:MAG TPA: hypothetical protein VNK04_03325 [Gemmataceae bacterium]|nr:hypothetical protein [Gemmataceae bacterium]
MTPHTYIAAPPEKPGDLAETRFAVRIPLIIASRCASAARQPITLGLPFPRGMLTDAAPVTLFDAAGCPLLLQAEPLARWSDGSVKWLLLDFVLPPLEKGEVRWLLGPAEEAGDIRPTGLRVAESPSEIIIDTGAATFHLGRSDAVPLTRVRVAGRDIIEPGGIGARLTDAKGRSARPRVEQVAVETRGPVRATVRLEGAFEGTVPCRFVARLCFFAGTGLVRIRLTVHNPNRARHRGGLWDLGDPNSMLFRDLSIHVELNVGRSCLTWRSEAGQAPGSARAGDLEIYQDSSGGENWRSRNHVNREGRVPCTFRGYRVRTADREEFGLRASPVVSLQGDGGTLTAALPEFWQQFPKAIRVQGRAVRLQLFPEQFGDLFELQGGEQKTHTAWLHFGGPDGPPLAPLDWVHRPADVRVMPEWHARAGVVPSIVPGPVEAGARLDGYLAEVVTGPNSFFARRERIDEYGWRNYGDIYADHEEAHCPTPPPIISHYNNQYDVINGLILQYCRTGDPRWRDLFDPLARHVIDIDIYHTEQDKASYNGGLFWFTDHYLEAHTCTHRTYSRANRKPGHPYGGGPDSQHNFTTGLLHYYYLTGDPGAREAVISLANWVIAMDDGRRVPLLGLLDSGPTGLASHTAEADYHGPGRGSGNSINALLDGWLLTGRRVYLDKAEELIRRSIHPNDDVAARQLLNVEKRWSYPVHLSVLARYLDMKAEAEQLDFMYAYARASLLRYAGWMVEHERPYLDRPEELEYPNETWAAQEMRKANVLRLAAAHADEPLRSRLLRRGDELADRAWSSLLRFETRLTTRAVAIVLTEGTRDLAFRVQAPPPAPHPPEVSDFGDPERFVSQKTRIRAALKSPLGLARALLRLANPRNWGNT